VCNDSLGPTVSGETEDQSAKISSPKNADQKWSGKVRVGPRFGFGPVRNFAKHEALGTVLGISHVYSSVVRRAKKGTKVLAFEAEHFFV
jgi:hypothetical protein